MILAELAIDASDTVGDVKLGHHGDRSNFVNIGFSESPKNNTSLTQEFCGSYCLFLFFKRKT